MKLKPPVGVSKSLLISVIAIELNHLNGWFIQEQNTVIAQRHKTAVAVFGIIFLSK